MKRLFFFLTIAALLLSCSNTQLISSWQAENASSTYNKILVLALMGDKDRVLRESLENYVSEQLKSNGINAVTASQQYGPRSFKNMTEEAAVKMINDDGFDGVIVIALVDKTKNRDYVAGSVTTTPYAIIRSRWYNRYMILYDQVYTPGYYTTTTDYILEANFYNEKSKEDKLVYSAQAKVMDPSSAANLADNFGKTILKDMLKKNIISKQ